MKKTIIWLAVFVLLPASFAHSQTKVKTDAPPNVSAKPSAALKTTPAYAEVLLRKTEREAELEELRLDFTEEFPKVKELKYESDLLQKEMNKILAVNPAEAGKLTLALGKLLVRKVEIEVELWNLKRQYSDEQPEVQRTRRKIEVYEKAVKEILQ